MRWLRRASIQMEKALRLRQRNRLLGSLSESDLDAISPFLDPVPLNFRQRLQGANRKLKSAYFPESGLASVVAIGGGERRQAEVAIIGREGMTGLPILYGTDRSPCEIFMQHEGEGQCISADDLSNLIKANPAIHRCFLKFAHVFAVQSSFTALANARGKLEERLARWILMASDRLDSDLLHLTHAF